MPSGGARLNAGRPPKPQLLVRKALATEILGAVDEVAIWQGLLWSPNEKVRLEALKYLTDRRDGKAAQSLILNTDLVSNEPTVITFDFTRNGGLGDGF